MMMTSMALCMEWAEFDSIMVEHRGRTLTINRKIKFK